MLFFLFSLSIHQILFNQLKKGNIMINEHRKVGKALNLFEMSENSSGMVLWKPKGFFIYNKIEQYLRAILNKNGHDEVRSPIMADSMLWEKSGHLEKYQDKMFLSNVDDKIYAIKPMNCPFHIEMFNSEIRSYKDLPLRMVEFGNCHRNESSGSLNGLLRLRNFVQDDGHVFCQESDIKNELSLFMEMIFEVYEKFGFDKKAISINISLRPKERVGSDQLWDRAEKGLQEGLDELGLKYGLLPEEGAFYGPKVEISLKDSLKREWQCGTFQLDFFLAERMGASFINKDGCEELPIILHRALLGSLERFIAILLEHYSGKLPHWLNPNAIKIIPVGEEHVKRSIEIMKKLKSLGLAVIVDDSNDSLGYKMRSHFKNKGCYSIIIGDKELESELLSIREKKNQYELSINDFINKLLDF